MNDNYRFLLTKTWTAMLVLPQLISYGSFFEGVWSFEFSKTQTSKTQTSKTQTLENSDLENSDPLYNEWNLPLVLGIYMNDNYRD